MKNLPESFCVKANQKHELWNEFIQWLNEKGESFNGLSNSAYGLKDGEPNCDDPWAEVITLEEWHEAVNAKSEFPASYCIKRNEKHPLWDRFINFLNQTHEIKWDGEFHLYYGMEDGLRRYYSAEAQNLPEEVTLEQWFEYVEGHPYSGVNLPTPVFVTKSGVEIYDDVEMLVWDNEEAFAVQRRVIAKSMTDRWVFVNEHHNFLTAKNAKPIPEEVEVTMEEIAKWKGVDVKQIKIK